MFDRRPQPVMVDEQVALRLAMELVLSKVQPLFVGTAYGDPEETIRRIVGAATTALDALYRSGAMWRNDLRIGARFDSMHDVNLYWYRYVD